jgi:hypothetical protein
MLSDETIKELCARVIEAEAPDFERAANDLRAALKKHAESLRGLAAAVLLNPQTPPGDLPDA